ncbi:hypothetical protein [Fusibacter bizertensis]
MKNNPITYFQLRESKSSIILYYAIIIILFSMIGVQLGKNQNGSISGLDGMTVIFLFILGLNSFKDSFRLAIQNAVSRKNYYIGSIKTIIMVSVGMALIDSIFGFILAHLTNYESFFYQLYNMQDQILFSSNFVLGLMMRIVINIFAMHLGLFITIFYYKLTRFWVYFVSIVVPVFLFIIFPNINHLLFRGSSVITNMFNNFWQNFEVLLFGTPFRAIVSWVFFALVLSAGIFYMIKKTELKKSLV